MGQTTANCRSLPWKPTPGRSLKKKQHLPANCVLVMASLRFDHYSRFRVPTSQCLGIYLLTLTEITRFEYENCPFIAIHSWILLSSATTIQDYPRRNIRVALRLRHTNERQKKVTDWKKTSQHWKGNVDHIFNWKGKFFSSWRQSFCQCDVSTHKSWIRC